MPANSHLLVDAKDSFIKFEIQVFAKIGSTLGATATPTTLTENISEQIAKNVAEIVEDRGIKPGWTAAVATHASMSESVI
jgi:hypothetical protein